MANIKSKIKRTKTNEKSRQSNASFKSLVKTTIKKYGAAIKENSKDAEKLLTECFKLIDSGITKNIFHKNKANRNKSQLAKLFNKKSLNNKIINKKEY